MNPTQRAWNAFKTLVIWQTITFGAIAVMIFLTGCATLDPNYKGDTASRTLDAACSDTGVLMVCIYRGFEKDTSDVECFECSKLGRDPNFSPDGSYRR